MSHRITGLILIFAGLIILLGLSVIMLGKRSFEQMLVMIQLPFFRVMAHITVIALYWHILNGIKILIIDLFKVSKAHKILTIIMIIIFTVGIILYFINVYPQLLPL